MDYHFSSPEEQFYKKKIQYLLTTKSRLRGDIGAIGEGQRGGRPPFGSQSGGITPLWWALDKHLTLLKKGEAPPSYVWKKRVWNSNEKVRSYLHQNVESNPYSQPVCLFRVRWRCLISEPRYPGPWALVLACTGNPSILNTLFTLRNAQII